MGGFSDEVVAAAFDVAALPPTPFSVHERVMTTGGLEPREIEPSYTGAARWTVGPLTLVARPDDRWAVRDLADFAPVRYLSRTGHWSVSGGEGDEWERIYWHDFGTAVRLAQDDQRCLCCGATYTADVRAGERNSAVCCPPTEDEVPVAGYGDIEIPAWCAARGAFVWRGAEGLEFDRPCRACGGSGRYPLTATDEGMPLSWRPCPACRPTPADIADRQDAVAKYGKDHF